MSTLFLPEPWKVASFHPTTRLVLLLGRAIVKTERNCSADRFAHWWEQNDAKLAFAGRDPAESHNRTMKSMQESLLDLQHRLAEQVESIEQGLETHMKNMSADFVWLREKLK